MTQPQALDVEVIDEAYAAIYGARAEPPDLDVIVSISLTHVGALAGAIALARPRGLDMTATRSIAADDRVAFWRSLGASRRRTSRDPRAPA